MMTAAALVLAATAAFAQLNPYEPIAADKELRTGRLDNGMTYYLRHNEKPKGQADFYILHNVGAIQENDSQQGLAHFLEHMAFNGTKNLPDKMLIQYLEKVGVKFGANLNAGTSWDYTIYNMSDVPTSRQGIVDTALLILHDWSQFITLDPKEIDNERGVIMEELRTRDGAQWRSTIKMLQAVGKGTKYAERNLIGYLDGLKSFGHDQLEEFYHTWYRPDYQAVIVVGDIDVDAVEAQIKSLMSDIPAPAADAPQKEYYTAPDNDAPIVSINTDPEMMASYIQLFIKRPALPNEANGVVYGRMLEIMTDYISTMENSRLSDISMKPDAPFISASMFDGSIGIMPTVDMTQFFVRTEDGKLLEGFEAVYAEMEKIRRFGFTDGEYERAQNDLMRAAEQHYANRNDRRNSEYVDMYVKNYQNNSPVPDAETEWQLDSMLIKSIPLEQLNMIASRLIVPTNQVIVVNAPEKEGIANPTEEQILASIVKIQNAELEAYEDTTVKEPLIADESQLKGSAVKKVAQNDVLGTTEWTLKNGIRILVKPTDLKADEVIMTAKTLGGLSNLDNTDYYTGDFLPYFVAYGGVSKFSANDLRKQLSGKSANVMPYTADYEHGMQGQCSPKDLETMLQLLYLRFTAPRFTEDDSNTLMRNFRAQVENLRSNPDVKFEEEFNKVLYNDNFRRQIISAEVLDMVDFNRLQAVHDQLFSGANSFTFTFVGNVDMETLKPLVEKYIGSLPVQKKLCNYADDGVKTVKGNVDYAFRTPMQQPKVSVRYYLSGDCDYSIENRMKMTYLTQALSSRYLESVREEKGGSYGVQVYGSSKIIPEQTYGMTIAFDTNEEMADELCEVILAELDKMAAEGPIDEDFNKTREFLNKNWNNTLEENAGWVRYIDEYYFNGLDYISNYQNTLNATTQQDVRDFMRKMLADGNVVKVVMRPEAAEAE
ncbi:MAG: insulinase family protein [Alistipes sp.]|nr:insulinase family protein [Alistipes sp.]